MENQIKLMQQILDYGHKRGFHVMKMRNLDGEEYSFCDFEERKIKKSAIDKKIRRC